MSAVGRDDGSGARRTAVRQQYEAWPYPHVPIIANVRRSSVWQLNLHYLFDRCALGQPPARPNIWIAGCGTLQPYVIRLANPRARILATDVSERSLRVAQRRCLWHGLYGVRFEGIDLEDESALPEGPFDWIECYGVLMNLSDPTTTLRRLAERLSPRGVLRLMVYPHFSRQRVFQIQRLARLCGLGFDRRAHPRVVRSLMRSLPAGHPLRFTFDTYEDAEHDAGLVDGFLHAGDRGFTGLELGAAIEAAGLRPAWWFHRPWGQPDLMAKHLQLEASSQSFVLHYLDLWQELRTNFIACLTHGSAPRQGTEGLRPHPLLDLRQSRTFADMLNRLAQRFIGVHLPSRTESEDWYIGSDELRLMRRFARHPDYDAPACARLRDIGVLLGGEPRPEIQLPPHADRSAPGRRPALLELGPQVPNPLYHHLFEAWRYTETPLIDQIERWRPVAEPLEGDRYPFGLTPFRTFEVQRSAIERYLSTTPEAVTSWEDWHLRNAPVVHDQVTRFLRTVPDLPKRDWSPGELTELWVLLFSHRHLFLDTE